MTLNILLRRLLFASGFVATVSASPFAMAKDEMAPPPGPYHSFNKNMPDQSVAANQSAASPQAHQCNHPGKGQCRHSMMNGTQQPAWANQRAGNQQPNWKLPELPGWVKQRQADMRKKQEAAQNQQEDMQKQMPAMSAQPAWANQQQKWKQPEPPEWVSKQRAEAEKHRVEIPQKPDWTQAQNWQQAKPPAWVSQQRVEIKKRRTEMPPRQSGWGQARQWQRPSKSEWFSNRQAEMQKHRAAPAQQYTRAYPRQGSNWEPRNPPEWVKQQRAEQEKRAAELREQREREQAEISKWRPKDDEVRTEQVTQPQTPVHPGYFGAPNIYGAGRSYPPVSPGYGYDPRRFNPWAAQRPVWNRP